MKIYTIIEQEYSGATLFAAFDSFERAVGCLREILAASSPRDGAYFRIEPIDLNAGVVKHVTTHGNWLSPASGGDLTSYEREVIRAVRDGVLR